jgi:hypothetical protein
LRASGFDFSLCKKLLKRKVTHHLKIRGMVRADGDITDDDTLDTLLGKGQIVVTLYNAQLRFSIIACQASDIDKCCPRMSSSLNKNLVRVFISMILVYAKSY